MNSCKTCIHYEPNEDFNKVVSLGFFKGTKSVLTPNSHHFAKCGLITQIGKNHCSTNRRVESLCGFEAKWYKGVAE